MPKRVRPYGSAVDAESAALARNRSGSGGELVSELASTMTARDIASQAAEAVRELNDLTADGADFAGLDDVREVIASLRRMSQDLPRLCEQLARILVVQREDGHPPPGPDPEFWVDRRGRGARRGRAGRGHAGRRAVPGRPDLGRAAALVLIATPG